jgi:DNA-binding transcriptional regulator/RsmH inhibitor MraZ
MGAPPNISEALTPCYQGAFEVHLEDKFRFRLPSSLHRVFAQAHDHKDYVMALDVAQERIVLLPRGALSKIFGDADLREISPLLESYQPDKSQRSILPELYRNTLPITDRKGTIILAGHYDYMAIYTQAGWTKYLERIKTLQPAHQPAHEIRQPDQAAAFDTLSV